MSKIYDENGNDVDLDEWLKQKKTKLITRESTIEEVQRYADVYEVPYGENIPIDCGWFFTLADKAYKKGRADAINECIKLIGGNIKSIVGIYNSDTPITDRASYRVAKNELIEDLVKQLEQLKEQK